MLLPGKHSFKVRVLVTYLIAFSIFGGAILIYQYNREKKYRTAQLENTLDNISTLTHNYIVNYDLLSVNEIASLDSLLRIIPAHNARITVIDTLGVVLYDSEVEEPENMENHLMRPEVQESLSRGHGSSIRQSATTKQSYYYYSIHYEDHFIRTAVLYNVELRDFLKTERIFLLFMLTLILIMILLVLPLSRHLSNFVDQLRDFAFSAALGEEIEKIPNFSDRELDDIVKKIVDIYNRLNKTKRALLIEKDKLFEHLNTVGEGIAIYDKKGELSLNNSHFIQYLKHLASKKQKNDLRPDDVELLEPIMQFIDKYKRKGMGKRHRSKTMIINKDEKYFQVKAILFTDLSYEILITDITKLEKRKLIKKQLTSNIAHELKTPLTSIKGYLETIINAKELTPEKQMHFIRRAFMQSERLTNLLNDISLLNNIEDAGDMFEYKKLNFSRIVKEVVALHKNQLREKDIACKVILEEEITVYGNESLLFSVVQNFIENSIKYGGDNINIRITQYHKDEKMYYFSYADNGVGIPLEHQARIFERFYRVDKGRTREKGGTGLGLSIVKNAILLHKGEISLKNNPEGGVEFLFSLPKA